MRRLAVGFAAVAVLKEGSRAALRAALPLAYRAFPLRVRRLWQPPVHNLAAPAPAPAAADATVQLQALPAAGGKAAPLRNGYMRTRAAAKAAASSAGKGWAAADGSSPAPRAVPADKAAAGPLPPLDPRLAELPHDELGRPWDVEVTSRFFGYAGIGVAVAGVAPRLFAALGW